MVVDFKAAWNGKRFETPFHTVDAQIQLLDQQFNLRGTVTRRSADLDGAVSALANELTNLCKTNYWYLQAQRQ